MISVKDLGVVESVVHFYKDHIAEALGVVGVIRMAEAIRARQEARRYLTLTATGEDLDLHAEHVYGLRRGVETDEELRARCIAKAREFRAGNGE